MILSPKVFLNELVRMNIINQQQAQAYEVDSITKNSSIDQYLIQNARVDKETVLKIKAKLLNTEYVDVIKTPLDPRALSLVPTNIAKAHRILPYSYNIATDTIYIATADPLNLSLIEFLQVKTGKHIILALGSEEDIVRMINYAYLDPNSAPTATLDTVAAQKPATSNQAPAAAVEQAQLTTAIDTEVKAAVKDVDTLPSSFAEQQAIDKTVESAPIAKIVNTVLDYAVNNRASDIHIEPLELKTRVRYRIDGMLKEVLTLPKSIHESLVARIKILSALKIDEKRIPQDGRFTFKNDKNEVDLRVSTLPIVHGEKIVMRLLKKTGGVPSLKDLGLQGPQLRDLEELIKHPYGIFLVTGPTGSGKSTTLYSVLNKLNAPTVNIVTLEDPVEYQLAGINQVQINPQAGLTFATGLRSFLRQDPNIILVGEIRDKETTQLAIQAALTGHLVFATLHTNDAATTIPRLIDLGGEPFLIASVLLAALAQRIIRKVCNTCKTVYEPSVEVQNEIKATLGSLLPVKYNTTPIQLVKGTGCAECGNTGYLGRIGIFELLKVSPTINKMILQAQTAVEIEKKAREEGFITRRQDGYLKALDGLTTLEEVLRVAE